MKELKHIKMDYETWANEFKPMTNYIDENSSFDQTLFETYGDEVEHVNERACTPDTKYTVWTYIDGEDGTYIVDGYHYVNRVGHFITEKSADPDATYEILVDKYSDDDEAWDTTVGDYVPEMEVLKTPYFADCDRIWALIDGKDSELSYEQVETARAIHTSEERLDGRQDILLSDGRRATIQTIDLQYNGKDPIGAMITYRWNDDDKLREGLWGGYVSFGEYDEENGTDTYGVKDDLICYYFPNGVMEMVAYMMENKGEFTIVEYVYAYTN